MGKIGKVEEKFSLEGVEVMEMHWDIPNFISLSNSYHESPNFKFLALNWHLKVDPFQNDSIDHVALFLESDNDELSCNIMCTFGIKKTDGSITFIRSLTHAFCSKTKSFKADKFFTRSALKQHASELLPSDILTITCKLIHLSDKNGSSQFKDLDTLSENIRSLCINNDLCDIMLQLPGKEFQAHKLILAARSSVFAAMFKHETLEKQTGVINIPDCDPESFQIFLEYIYSGELEDISVHSALHLYKISDKYDIQKLKMFCVKYMATNLKIENFSDVIVLAEEYDETGLFSAAQNFFSRNLRDIFASDEWKTLFKNNFILANKLLLGMATKEKNAE